MSQPDRLALARVLLARAIDDETLVRKVSPDTDITDAIVGFHSPWPVIALAMLSLGGLCPPLPAEGA
jgi:hypothetical protein